MFIIFLKVLSRKCVLNFTTEVIPLYFFYFFVNRKILKKRVRMEYRIRKRTKNEKDFIQYIEVRLIQCDILIMVDCLVCRPPSPPLPPFPVSP